MWVLRACGTVKYSSTKSRNRQQQQTPTRGRGNHAAAPYAHRRGLLMGQLRLYQNVADWKNVQSIAPPRPCPTRSSIRRRSSTSGTPGSQTLAPSAARSYVLILNPSRPQPENLFSKY